jgi:hypothetical protein
MFVEDYDPTTLRQGDIIVNVPFPLPKIQAKPKFLGTYKQGVGQHVDLAADTEQIGRTWWLTAHINVSPSFCAVLSQDCDVAPKQNPPPPSFVLCRLVPVSDGIKKNNANFERLKANIDPYGNERPFYQLFYVCSHPRLGGEDYVADYGMAMTVMWRDYDTLLKSKTLEMNDETRAKFRVKAGAYFGRPTEDEISSGLAHPWETAREPHTPQTIGHRIARAYRILTGKES